MTNGAGAIQAQYIYDPWGQANKIQGGLNSDFQFGDYYFHAPSGLNLMLRRSYSSRLGRFISRDPIEEDGGTNLYSYMDNHPVLGVDPSGTCALAVPIVLGGGSAAGAFGAAIALGAASAMGVGFGGALAGALSGSNSNAAGILGNEFNDALAKAKADAAAKGQPFDPCKWIRCLIEATPHGPLRNKYIKWGKGMGCVNMQKRKNHY